MERLEVRLALASQPILTSPSILDADEGEEVQVSFEFTDAVSTGGGDLPGLDPFAYDDEINANDPLEVRPFDTSLYTDITSVLVKTGLEVPELIVTYALGTATDVFYGTTELRTGSIDPDVMPTAPGTFVSNAFEIAVFAFDSFNLGAPFTITAAAGSTRPVAFLSQSTLNVAGTINVSANGTAAGPGGGAGGALPAPLHGSAAAGAPVVTIADDPANGYGRNLGNLEPLEQGGGGGGFGGSGGGGTFADFTGNHNSANGGASSGDLFEAIQGGSGGAAGRTASSVFVFGLAPGGGGGGGVELGADGAITITGSVLANGAAGQLHFIIQPVGGGGGAGGGILLHGSTVEIGATGQLSARGGDGGGLNSSSNGGGGGGGGHVAIAYTVSYTNLAPPNAINVSGGGKVAVAATAGVAGEIVVEQMAGMVVPELYSYVIDWGDGSLDATGTSNPEGGITLGAPSGGIVTGSFGGSHVYMDDDADDLYTITVTVTDEQGNAVDTFDVTVTNVAPLNVVLDPIATVAENGLAVLDLSFDDPGVNDAHAVTVDWGDGSVMTYPALAVGDRAGQFTHQYLDDNPSGTSSDNYTVTVTIDDGDGGVSFPVTTTATVDNVAPFSLTLQPVAAINENGTAVLDLSFMDPGSLDSHLVTINWGDGNVVSYPALAVGDRSGQFMHQYLDDDPTGTSSDVYAISVTINDDDLGSVAAGTTVAVSNVGPVIVSLGNTSSSFGGAIQGQTVSLTGSYADPGTLDTHTATIDWGDDTALQTAAQSGGAIAASHVYAHGGFYTVTYTLADDDGGQDAETTLTVIAGVGLHNGVLQIIGTNDRDEAEVFKNSSTSLKVVYELGGVAMPTESFNSPGVAEIHMYLGGGNDFGFVSQNLTIPTTMFGGDGNDTLIGGNGHDRLLGENGWDLLIGRHGYDILIGGAGTDLLIGDSGSDILISGTTTHDNDLAALDVILAEWTSSRSYAERVANVTQSEDKTLELDYYFAANETVFDDGVTDFLSGGGDKDLFFASDEGGLFSQDWILDLQNHEFVEELAAAV